MIFKNSDALKIVEYCVPAEVAVREHFLCVFVGTGDLQHLAH